jgi:hypothetical protein
MLTILEKANNRVEIIQSPGHGLMRFRYNGQVGNWFDFYTNALDKVQYFRNRGWKEAQDKESDA